MTDLLSIALSYARRGWPVIPLHTPLPDGRCSCGNAGCANQGKHPRTAHGLKDATTDLAQIREWWTKWPNANIGIATGPLSGIFALDKDPRHGSEAALADLVSRYGPPPSTVSVRTGSGGGHDFYKYPPDRTIPNSAGKLGPGLDIRGDGGCVVAASSPHLSGRHYEWEPGRDPDSISLAEAPDWMLDGIEKNATPSTGRGRSPDLNYEELLSGVPEGRRNETLFREASKLRSLDVPQTIAEGLLLVIARACTPPFPEPEALHCVQSAYERYTPGRAIGAPESGSGEPPPLTRFRHPLTDLGNSEQLIAACNGDFRFCDDWGKWLVYDGHVWNVDHTNRILELAKATARAILQEAASETDPDKRIKLAKHAIASESERSIQAMVKLAKSSLMVEPKALDCHPWLLNVKNGTINLVTGELLPPNRAHLITKMADAEYDPNAPAPRWDAFLQRVLNDDAETIAFVQKAVGYSATGITTERVLFVTWGGGRNGKSTMLSTVREVLGDYALHTPTETLMVKREGAIPNDVARLRGARFVTAIEAEEGKRLAESLVKSLTGNDPVAARYMRGEWFTFVPECKFWLATNYKPDIRGTEEAIWDRIRLIPFVVRIADHELDKALAEKLRQERNGILRWIVDGCLLWQRDGLSASPTVREATATYRRESDVLGEFLEDRCRIDPTATATAADLYGAYQQWAQTNGWTVPMTPTKFGRRLTERGIQKKPHGPKNVRTYFGIGLLPIGFDRVEPDFQVSASRSFSQEGNGRTVETRSNPIDEVKTTLTGDCGVPPTSPPPDSDMATLQTSRTGRSFDPIDDLTGMCPGCGKRHNGTCRVVAVCSTCFLSPDRCSCGQRTAIPSAREVSAGSGP